MINFFELIDTLKLKKSDGKTVPVLRTGIAWPSDKQMKFRNPHVLNKNLSESIATFVTINMVLVY